MASKEKGNLSISNDTAKPKEGESFKQGQKNVNSMKKESKQELSAYAMIVFGDLAEKLFSGVEAALQWTERDRKEQKEARKV